MKKLPENLSTLLAGLFVCVTTVGQPVWAGGGGNRPDSNSDLGASSAAQQDTVLEGTHHLERTPSQRSALEALERIRNQILAEQGTDWALTRIQDQVGQIDPLAFMALADSEKRNELVQDLAASVAWLLDSSQSHPRTVGEIWTYVSNIKKQRETRVVGRWDYTPRDLLVGLQFIGGSTLAWAGIFVWAYLPYGEAAQIVTGTLMCCAGAFTGIDACSDQPVARRISCPCPALVSNREQLMGRLSSDPETTVPGLSVIFDFLDYLTSRLPIAREAPRGQEGGGSTGQQDAEADVEEGVPVLKMPSTATGPFEVLPSVDTPTFQAPSAPQIPAYPVRDQGEGVDSAQKEASLDPM